MLKHPAECGLVVHTQTHSAGCHDTHAVSLSSVRASKIKEGDGLAESGERELAAKKYSEAISQLKSVRQSNEARLREIANKFLQCAYQHGRILINNESSPNSRDINKVFEEIDAGEGSKNSPKWSIYREIRERIAEGDRLLRDGEYDAAIDYYQETKHVIDQRMEGSSGKTLKTEINMNVRKARRKKQSEENNKLRQEYSETQRSIDKNQENISGENSSENKYLDELNKTKSESNIQTDIESTTNDHMGNRIKRVYCTNCGHELYKEAQFCTVCGNKQPDGHGYK